MPVKTYVFDYYVFASRRGIPPNPWVWEIRRKSKPDEPSVSVSGFRSAKAAEEAGKLVLAQVRASVAKKLKALPAVVAPVMTAERRSEIARNAIETRWRRSLTKVRRLEIREAKANRKPLTSERRSENARKAALARAEALTPERRSEIGRMGGSATKGKPKKKRRTAHSDSR